MLDVSFAFAPHLALALASERERAAEDRKWLRRLREFEARDRKTAGERSVVVSKPAHLAGTHKL